MRPVARWPLQIRNGLVAARFVRPYCVIAITLPPAVAEKRSRPEILAPSRSAENRPVVSKVCNGDLADQAYTAPAARPSTAIAEPRRREYSLEVMRLQDLSAGPPPAAPGAKNWRPGSRTPLFARGHEAPRFVSRTAACGARSEKLATGIKDSLKRIQSGELVSRPGRTPVVRSIYRITAEMKKGRLRPN